MRNLFQRISSRIVKVAVFGVVFLQSEILIAQDGESLFKQNCASCHSIGKGAVVGPDLKGLSERRSEEWILKFVKSSQSFIASGDKDAVAVFEENKKIVMPDQNLKDDQIKSIIAHISTVGSSQSEPKSADTVKAITESELNNADLIKRGMMLYQGDAAFVNHGPSCISCHNVNKPELISGGLLAADLTNVYTKVGGIAGLNGILANPPFPAMTVSFKDKPLKNEEINALIAFLHSVDVPIKQQKAPSDFLLLGGILAFMAGIALIYMVWFSRKKATVKKSIYDRQIESIN